MLEVGSYTPVLGLVRHMPVVGLEQMVSRVVEHLARLRSKISWRGLHDFVGSGSVERGHLMIQMIWTCF